MIRKSVLIFVQIPTHFSEMIRVAELLESSSQYRPVMLFSAMYQGVEQHIKRCEALNIDLVLEKDFYRYLPQEKNKKNWFKSLTDWIVHFFHLQNSFFHLQHSLFHLSRSFFHLLQSFLHLLRPWVGLFPCKGFFYRFIFLVKEKVSIFFHALFSRVLSKLFRQAIRVSMGMLRQCFRFFAAGLFRPLPSTRLKNSFISWPRLLRMLVLLPVRAFEIMIALVFYPFKPLIRFAILAGFGFIYKYLPKYLPPDIKVQRYQWSVIPRILSCLNIEVLILPEDNFFYNTNYFVKAVHDKGGVAVVVPFTIVNMLEWSEAFYGEPSHDAGIVINRITSFLFPKWLHEHKGKALIQPFQQILCNAYFKTEPPVPWLINSGYADAIAAESRFMVDYYRRAGIPEQQISFTGAMYDDVLYAALQESERRREHLYARLKMPPGKPMVLCGVPPNQLLGAGRGQCEFLNYTDLLRSFMAPLKKLVGTHNVILNFHPRISQGEISQIEMDGMFAVTDNIAELVPLCQFYVASCSATIRLAINCGIPVVNYDVYQYNYDDYEKVPGVCTINQYGEYADLIQVLGSRGPEYEQLVLLQQQFSRQHTQLDGKAGARLIDLLGNLLHRRQYAA